MKKYQKINKVKSQISKIYKVKCQMSKINKVKCQMSKINKVNFDGAYLRSSFDHFLFCLAASRLLSEIKSNLI